MFGCVAVFSVFLGAAREGLTCEAVVRLGGGKGCGVEEFMCGLWWFCVVGSSVGELRLLRN